ncbi:MAG: hypothetical protein FD134_164 [Gallionellaceae bacterium]|nr:MAG: hypothetical protein FD134_164 [Gallionellaceae bacterium]
MNLDYKILWYDDNKDYFESRDNDRILSEILSWGFRPHITPVHDPEELSQHKPFSDFDMLIVDFDLGANVSGAKFIKSVRDLNVYAEIIFYSMKGEEALWQAVIDERLQGIYVATKPVIDTKLLEVARHSVSKVLDLENMRGIVMAEVGDLDELLEKIFTLAMQGITEEQRQLVYKAFIKKSKEPDKKFEEALSAFESEPSIESLLVLSDGSEKRVQNFNRVKAHHPLLKTKNFADEYREAILSPRNFLAHGVPERNGEGSLLFRHRGKEFSFDDEIGKILRHKILEYKSAFSEIVDALNQQ